MKHLGVIELALDIAGRASLRSLTLEVKLLPPDKSILLRKGNNVSQIDNRP